MNNKLKFGLLSAIIVGTLGWIAASGAMENGSYYKTVTEIAAMGDSAKEKSIRVGGDVVPGSIVREGKEVKFRISQDKAILNVVYNGKEPLPDTFKDGSQALAQGRLGSDGVFHASNVQAKCASKYEAKAPKGANEAAPATHQAPKPVAAL
ncbi:MAG: cytochrome c maturation protein CcmE [Acidobacteria bacterium]|nr:cytochrome c maturation protein CcmE [Acidobacteriota bacterium]